MIRLAAETAEAETPAALCSRCGAPWDADALQPVTDLCEGCVARLRRVRELVQEETRCWRARDAEAAQAVAREIAELLEVRCG